MGWSGTDHGHAPVTRSQVLHDWVHAHTRRRTMRTGLYAGQALVTGVQVAAGGCHCLPPLHAGAIHLLSRSKKTSGIPATKRYPPSGSRRTPRGPFGHIVIVVGVP